MLAAAFWADTLLICVWSRGGQEGCPLGFFGCRFICNSGDFRSHARDPSWKGDWSFGRWWWWKGEALPFGPFDGRAFIFWDGAFFGRLLDIWFCGKVVLILALAIGTTTLLRGFGGACQEYILRFFVESLDSHMYVFA